MEKVIHSLLLEFEHLALLTVTVGLLISASLRMMSGRELQSNNGFGKVRTSSFGGVDLVAIFLLLAFYYLSFLSDPLEKKSLIVSPELLIGGLVMSLFLATIVLVTVQWVGGRNPVELFGLHRVSFSKWLLWVLAGVLLVTPLILLLSEWTRSEWLEPVFGEMKEQEVVNSMRNTKGIGLKIGMIVSACIVAPLVEELVFRGYIYGVLKRFTNPLFAMMTAGALFAAVHVNLPALLPLWAFALILTLAYERSGSLWVPIGIHAGFNTVSVVVMLSGGG